jgi:DNA-binding transcriptional ArsR family regulator
MQRHTAVLDRAFFALSDPTRRELIARLAAGPLSVAELARPFPMSGPAISQHLKTLEEAGLVSRGRSAQSRPARLEGASLRLVADWLAPYQRFWTESVDSLATHLESPGRGQQGG